MAQNRESCRKMGIELNDLAIPVSGVTDKVACLVCKKWYSVRVDNLRRHWKEQHPIEWQKKLADTIEVQTPITTKEMYIQNVVEIFCKGNTTFQFWSLPAVKLNQKAYADKFGMNCSAETMTALIKSYAAKVRDDLRQQLRGKYLSLKYDIATRRHRSILGISAQYLSLEEGKIKIVYLKMAPITESTTAVYLKHLIDQCLAEYGVEKHFIYSSTTDNGSNVLRTSKDILSEVNLIMSQINDGTFGDTIEVEEEVEDEEEDGAIGGEDQELLHRSLDTVPEEDEEENPDESLASLDTSNFEDSLYIAELEAETAEPSEMDVYQNLREAIEELFHEETRCACHVIQLSVHTFTNKKARQSVISKTRTKAKVVCKYLRTLPDVGRPPLPKLSTQTRWSSTYYMVCFNEPLSLCFVVTKFPILNA